MTGNNICAGRDPIAAWFSIHVRGRSGTAHVWRHSFMAGTLKRRDFLKLVAGACCATGLAGAKELAVGNSPPKLQLFDYSGVKLLDGRLQRQYQEARDLFFSIPNDNLLLGFRQRAGLPAPGTP